MYREILRSNTYLPKSLDVFWVLMKITTLEAQRWYKSVIFHKAHPSKYLNFVMQNSQSIQVCSWKVPSSLLRDSSNIQGRTIDTSEIVNSFKSHAKKNCWKSSFIYTSGKTGKVKPRDFEVSKLSTSTYTHNLVKGPSDFSNISQSFMKSGKEIWT